MENQKRLKKMNGSGHKVYSKSGGILMKEKFSDIRRQEDVQRKKRNQLRDEMARLINNERTEEL